MAGIYILTTAGPEYRVAFSEDVDKIFGEFNDINIQFDPNPKELFKVFGSAPVFLKRAKAFDYAQQLAKGYDYLDDGVCELDNFEFQDFNELTS